LFEAIILERCDRLLEGLPTTVFDAGSDLEVALRAIASRLLELMLTPEFVARLTSGRWLAVDNGLQHPLSGLVLDRVMRRGGVAPARPFLPGNGRPDRSK